MMHGVPFFFFRLHGRAESRYPKKIPISDSVLASESCDAQPQAAKNFTGYSPFVGAEEDAVALLDF